MKDYLIFETDHFTVSQTGGYRVPGYVIVESKAGCTRVSEFTQEQAVDLTSCLAVAEELVQEIIKPERIYIMKFGEVNPRVHFHVFPRTKKIATAYIGDVEDEKPYNGARLVDWIWQNHESIGFTEAEIQSFVNQAKRITQTSNAA